VILPPSVFITPQLDEKQEIDQLFKEMNLRKGLHIKEDFELYDSDKRPLHSNLPPHPTATPFVTSHSKDNYGALIPAPQMPVESFNGNPNHNPFGSVSYNFLPNVLSCKQCSRSPCICSASVHEL
jgi:hypothetical protein